MNERDYLIEQCLVDAEKGYLVDESIMSWIKGKAAGAGKVAKNISTSFNNGAKNVKAGYKNTLGKMAGGDTHTAAKKEASNIKASRGSYEDAGAYANKVDRANRIKEAGVKREKQEAKDAKKLQKLAQKAYDAVQAYVDAGGKIMHGRTSSIKTTLKSLQQAAGIEQKPSPETTQQQPAEEKSQETPAQPTQKQYGVNDMKKGVKVKPVAAPAKKPVLKAPAKKKEKPEVNLTPVDGVDPYSAEWEEEANHSVTNVHESYKHINSNAQLRMLNSIR